MLSTSSRVSGGMSMMLSSVKVTDTVPVVSSGLSGDRAARSASICS